SYFHDPTEAQPLDDGSPEHPHLRVYQGFVCRKCNTRTTNFSLLRRHISSTHLYDKRSTRRELDELYDDVWLQTWTAGSNRTRKYWIIKYEGSLLRVNDDIQAHLQSVKDRERGQNDDTTNQGIIQENATTSLTFAEQRPWIERTGWDETYKGTSRDVLSALTDLP
ncbi:hypothetical protein BGZ61DRAFT_278230, partial [Ilyonectria robusta]|uniref:uncharacterized protein n=1 Tax=Ilyonectria robusta TaxID=1079257 RepID=UPI001E8DF888